MDKSARLGMGVRRGRHRRGRACVVSFLAWTGRVVSLKTGKGLGGFPEDRKACWWATWCVAEGLEGQ